MEDLVRYLDEIVEPTINELQENPTSVRHAFLACVAVFHTIDYLAFPDKKAPRALRQKFGRKSPEFAMVDNVAHAFKHVVAGNPKEPRLIVKEVISRSGMVVPVSMMSAKLGSRRASDIRRHRSS